jgi:hypothetical protein
VAATAKARLYPQFERFGTNELEWVLGFGQELVAKGLLNPAAEGKPLALIPPLLAERAAAARAMEAERATDQLENEAAAPGPAIAWFADADLDDMMHQAEIEDEMDAMPVDTMFSHAPGMR